MKDRCPQCNRPWTSRATYSNRAEIRKVLYCDNGHEWTKLYRRDNPGANFTLVRNPVQAGAAHEKG